MTPRLRSAPYRRPAALVLAALGVAALVTLLYAPPAWVPTGDESDYLTAAAHLARDGVFSHAPLAALHPPGDAYREPGYAWLLALWWRSTGTAVPEETQPPSATAIAATRAVTRLGALLLALAALAAARAARGAGAPPLAAIVTGVLVLASPALRQAALTAGSEGLSAALTAAAGAALVAAAGGAGAGALALAGLAAGLAPLARGAGLVLAPAGLLLLLAAPRDLPRRRRAARALAFALLALVPAALWALRNRAVTGHFVLADRGGQVLWTRAELDAEIARAGLAPALAAWTPLDAAAAAGDGRWPEARFARYEWTGEGNFFTRSLRRWHSERAGASDPLAADAALGREALAAFARRPLDHLRATVAVAWRGLFAERAPAALEPFDRTVGVALGLGLLLGAGGLAVAGRALFRRDVLLAALLAAPAALFLFHALATEFLPRFAVPALPLAWAALVVAWPQRGRS